MACVSFVDLLLILNGNYCYSVFCDVPVRIHASICAVPFRIFAAIINVEQNVAR